MMKKGLCRLLVPVLLVFSACACSTEGGIQQILGTSVEAPVFVDCRPVSSTELVFTFTRPVRVVTLNFDEELEAESVEEGQEVRITFSRPLEAGKKITADILVEDSGRNSLNVIVPFRARNDRMPALVFNELRLDYSKPNLEYLEILALEGGNLGAMRFFIASQSTTTPLYEFPPAEVKAGEYIVLHLRTLDEGTVDETGPELGLSAGNGAQDTARDLWIPGSKKLIQKTGGLWLLDQDDGVIDAVLMSEKPETDATNKNFMAASEFLGRQKAWLPRSGDRPDGWIPDPASAVNTTGTTATRTLCRDESIPPEKRAGNWYVTATSSATPGKPNNPKRFN